MKKLQAFGFAFFGDTEVKRSDIITYMTFIVILAAMCYDKIN